VGHLRVLATVALLMLAPIAALAPAPVGAAESCTAAIMVVPGERVASITALAPDAVVFEGNLSLTQVTPGQGNVTVTAVTYTGWAIVVSPATFQVPLGTDFDATFNITVVVPAATPATEIVQVTVKAVPAVTSGACATSYAQFIVSPGTYFGPWRIRFDSVFASVDSPGAASVNGTVTLQANAIRAGEKERAYLRFEAPPGIAVFGAQFVDLERQSAVSMSANFTLRVEARALLAGEYEVRAIVVRGPSDNASVAESEPLHVTVRASTPGIAYMALGASLAAAAGAAVVFWWRQRRR
jgi:hypothetical protein